MLEYLRDHVDDDELPRIKTASDVYVRSTRHMVKEALAKSVEARKIGLAAGAIPADKPTEGQISETWKLLAAVAFAMTSQLVTDNDEHSETHGQLIPNFSLIEPGSAFEDFREQVVCLMCKTTEPSIEDRMLVIRWLDALGAANDAVASGFYDSDTIGLNGILWRNRTLQEFFTALWCAKYATPEQSHNLWDWLYLAGHVATEPYYWINRFLAEMPKEGRSDKVWVESLEPVYRPGDGTPEGTKRSTEMLFRSWKTMHDLAGEPVWDWWDCSYADLIETEKKLKQGEPIPFQPNSTVSPEVRGQARKCLALFRGEFQQILDGTHGATLTPKQRSIRQAAAKELTENFIPVPDGEFRMGAPEEKQGMGPADRTIWQKLIDRLNRGESAEAIARSILDRNDPYFVEGRRGDELYEQCVAHYAGLLELREMTAIESRWYNKNQTPQAGEEWQQVANFELGEYPVLVSWYRLFAPSHGREKEWYAKPFAAVCQTERDPVIYTSWWDSWALSQWLNWNVGNDVVRCRLPHEPEFEFVAKNLQHWDWNYWWGDQFQKGQQATRQEIQDCNGNRRIGENGRARPPDDATPSFHGRVPRGQRGFRDLLGNVWEWMANPYREKYSRKLPPDHVTVRVLRGGAWGNNPTGCRSAFRCGGTPGNLDGVTGLRLVCVVCVRTS